LGSSFACICLGCEFASDEAWDLPHLLEDRGLLLLQRVIVIAHRIIVYNLDNLINKKGANSRFFELAPNYQFIFDTEMPQY
jgi:hypothetical protein